MTSEALGEMLKGDSADTFAGNFLLVSIGGRAEGLACADPGARTPIDASGNFYYCCSARPELQLNSAQPNYPFASCSSKPFRANLCQLFMV